MILACSRSGLFNFRLLFVPEIVSKMFNKLEFSVRLFKFLIVYKKDVPGQRPRPKYYLNHFK